MPPTTTAGLQVRPDRRMRERGNNPSWERSPGVEKFLGATAKPIANRLQVTNLPHFPEVRARPRPNKITHLAYRNL